MLPSQIINQFMQMFEDDRKHQAWIMSTGKDGKMNFELTPSHFYNKFQSCSEEQIEKAIEFYKNKKKKR